MGPTNSEEIKAFSSGYRTVAGIDEVGRGSIAGPVVAAAVVLTEDLNFLWMCKVRDSKKLTPLSREKIFNEIEESNIDFGIGIISPAEVDTLGIVRATKNAMIQAISNLAVRPDFLLIDAVPLSEVEIPGKAIIKGDEKCLSIAAASIVAKVSRDRIMVDEGNKFPEYGFEKHKGYLTPLHRQNLDVHGACQIHRMSFYPLTSYKI